MTITEGERQFRRAVRELEPYSPDEYPECCVDCEYLDETRHYPPCVPPSLECKDWREWLDGEGG